MKSKLLVGVFSLLFFISFASALTATQLNYSSFESGEQGWIFGGANGDRDNTRSNTTDLGASGGTWSAHLQDNTATSFFNASFNFSNQDSVNVSFSYFPSGFEGGEFVTLSCDGNEIWRWTNGDAGEEAWNSAQIRLTSSNCTFDENVILRFDGVPGLGQPNDDLWVDAINITGYLTDAPTLDNVTALPSPILGGNTITIYANTSEHGVNDTEGDTLNFYCDVSNTPTAANTDCTGGTTSDSSEPYVLSCSFVTPTNTSNHTGFCRTYDGSRYSTARQFNYTTDATPPNTNIISVEGDTLAAYFDTTDTDTTEINITGETNMLCRWSASDLIYTAMSNDCTISGTTASCSVDDVASQGIFTRYVACQDSLGNNQNVTQNLDIQFTLDYTAPSTTDNSTTSIQVPTYIVNISEVDNVDSDPTTLYCVDNVNSCTPGTSIDSGGTVSFTTSNRGVNYLRYYSTDDAGNQQTTVSRTININQLPVHVSASDDATTIQGGVTVNVTTTSYDPDGQDVTLYVCDSDSANSSGCIDNQYCTATGVGNLTCTFTSETDDTNHAWYSFIFDESSEAAANNSIQGNYTTDSTAPGFTITSPENTTYTQSSVAATIVLDEPGQIAYYSLDNGANVTMTNSSSTVWSSTLSGLSDGSHNITFSANDSYGNVGTSSTVFFVVDTTVPDTTKPVITVLNPINNTYYQSNSILLNISIDENASWTGYSINNTAFITLGNYTPTNWNATVTFSEGQNNLSFLANDSSANENQGESNLTIFVDITNPQITNFSCSTPTNDSINVNCTAIVNDSVGLDYAVIGWNATGSWQNTTSNISLTGVNGTIHFNITAANTTPPGFSTELFVFDLSGRSNKTLLSLLTSDDTFPTIFNITNSPNTTDSLDPGVQIDVNATIIEDYEISEVVLMYQNISSGTWTSIVMSNNSAVSNGSLATVVYNASFTPGNGTWVYQINVTDANNNNNLSSNVTFDVITEDSFLNSSTISTIKSFTFAQRSINNTLGTLYLNNTGDNQLNFTVNITSALRDRFDINYTNTPNATFVTNSGNNQSLKILVNTTDLGAALYSYNITVSSGAGSTTYENQLNIQTANGPLLTVNIDTFPSSVTTGDSNVELSASVENSGTANAENVYLNWTLPQGFTIVSGNQNRSLGTLGIGVSGTNTITINVGNTLFSSSVSINVTATDSGSNSDDDSETITISNPTSSTPSSTPTGTGGSGSVSPASGGSSSGVSSRGLEIVRGRQNVEFDISLTPPFVNSSLQDLRISVTGFDEQYVEINPSFIGEILYGEARNITISLNAPSYKESEVIELEVLIEGLLLNTAGKLRAYEDRQKIKLLIQEVSQQEVSDLLNEAEAAAILMKENNFNTAEVERLLERAKTILEEGRNKDAQDLANRIILIKDLSIESNDLINNILSVLDNPRKINLLTGNLVKEVNIDGQEYSINSIITGRAIFTSNSVSEVIDLARAAFERGDYDTALERAQNAQVLLILERKGNLGLFVYLYWHILLLGFIVLSISGFAGFKTYKKTSVTNKISDFNKEESNINQLLGETQKQYFSGKMSSSDFESQNQEYRDRLSKIRQERVKLRNKRIKILSRDKLLDDLENEKDDLENEIKVLQTSYYIDNKISQKIYDLQFKEFNERLAEIEGERITIELVDLKKNKKSIKNKVVNKTKESKDKTLVKNPSIKDSSNRNLVLLKHNIKKLKNRSKHKGHKKGVMLLDNKVVHHIKEGIKDKDVKGKWIKINHPRSKDEK